MLFPSLDLAPQLHPPLLPRISEEDERDGYAAGRLGAWTVAVGGLRFTMRLGGERVARSSAWWRGYDRGRREWIALTMSWLTQHVSGIDLHAHA